MKSFLKTCVLFFPIAAAGDIGSFLMTEARQQNTEIRLAVGKVADKLDNLADKVMGFLGFLKPT